MPEYDSAAGLTAVEVASKRPSSHVTRERILNSAAHSFARAGYNGTSLDEIASRAGISKAGLLYHFRSKRELLDTLLAERDEHNAWEFDQEALPLETIDSFRDVAANDIAHPTITRAFAVLLGESVALDSPVTDWFRQRYHDLEEQLRVALAEAVHEGQISGDFNAGEIAAEVIAVMDGLQIQWLLSGDDQAYLARLEGYLDRLLDWLVNR
ncbi:TetR/AcrR family transcriptional regulator [Lysinibacter sp. HNR]|uniref:TetR/AcrR family transcriptional regulator n=1 Tax=Lysinibacter sp. HNR TaxID=3031408 RepID=UPI0024350404|nr:TetR/AcrR family transcriptional regulator [Lysinibacter sp. HNR]WGD36769.1 TetR/AcrR family transcriptional regulator [Lysinibacter sp. HNR]